MYLSNRNRDDVFHFSSILGLISNLEMKSRFGDTRPVVNIAIVPFLASKNGTNLHPFSETPEFWLAILAKCNL